MQPGYLLITNDVDADALPAFEAWYQREHLDERLGVPGFRWGRRYRAVAAGRAFMALYETGDPGVLSSPAYLECLARPTARTRQVMPTFRRMCRTVMEGRWAFGTGIGSVLDLCVPADDQPPAVEALQAWAEALWTQDPAFEAARLLVRVPDAALPAGEGALRGLPDATLPVALLLEWNALAGPPPDAVAGTVLDPSRGGRYRLDCARTAAR